MSPEIISNFFRRSGGELCEAIAGQISLARFLNQKEPYIP